MIGAASVSIIVLALVATTGLVVRRWLRVPARRYEGRSSVADAYDAWTGDGFLEHYWGEHLHAGHYGNPSVAKDFVAAKFDYVDELIRFSLAPAPALVDRLETRTSAAGKVTFLDVGSGIGGSARHIAR